MPISKFLFPSTSGKLIFSLWEPLTLFIPTYIIFFLLRISLCSPNTHLPQKHLRLLLTSFSHSSTLSGLYRQRLSVSGLQNVFHPECYGKNPKLSMPFPLSSGIPWKNAVLLISKLSLTFNRVRTCVLFSFFPPLGSSPPLELNCRQETEDKAQSMNKCLLFHAGWEFCVKWSLFLH